MTDFRLIEYQRISRVFNSLAAHLQYSVAERDALTRQLLSVQEDERRTLARELHDEFGQCLTAVNAMAASIRHTAERECAALVAEGEAIARVVEHMMTLLQDMLQRLRPPDIDELGLVDSLRSLIGDWQNRCRGTVRFDFEPQQGYDFSALSNAVKVSIFRMVQECLTNIVKHANADRVRIGLARSGIPAASADTDNQSATAAGIGTANIVVTVEDNGSAGSTALDQSAGLGLIGMRERVSTLGGQLTLHPRQNRGLVVQALIPELPAAQPVQS
jgi:glucose-6-phosphate-specific signal transduction histidine kinase